jgi:hypothetical protein
MNFLCVKCLKVVTHFLNHINRMKRLSYIVLLITVLVGLSSNMLKAQCSSEPSQPSTFTTLSKVCAGETYTFTVTQQTEKYSDWFLSSPGGLAVAAYKNHDI